MQLRKTAANLGGQLSAKTEELNKFKSDLVFNPTATLQKVREESTKPVIDEVGKLYTLPSGEEPVTALVQSDDKSQPPLNQPFFVDAKIGDYLVIYEKSGLAILYRPSEKKLVKVGPIDIKNEPSVPEDTSTQP